MKPYEAQNLITEIAVRQNQRWDSQGNLDTSYPYPDKHIFSQIEGKLAEEVRQAFADGDTAEYESIQYTSVELREKVSYGGYSAYTQEHFKELTITCDNHGITFDGDDAFNELLQWLDERKPLESMSAENIKSAVAYAKAYGWEPDE